MKYSDQLQNLGTETAFAVSAQAKEWAEKGNKVYPFHLGDIVIYESYLGPKRVRGKQGLGASHKIKVYDLLKK